MSRRDIPRDGAMHEVAVDPRDSGTEWGRLGGRHGSARSCVTVHIPGVTERATVASNLHKMIAAMPAPPEQTGDLCGVEHVEDVGIWQVPHTGRDALRREVARLALQHRRPVVIVEGWQHVGPCTPEVAV